MKLADLIESHVSVRARMAAAHAANDDAGFTAAENELSDINAKLLRARKLEASERAEPGRPISGDAKLISEIRSRYSLVRALGHAAGLAVDAGFEIEIQKDLATRAGRTPQGLFVPTEIFETRVLTTSTGSELVPTDHRPDQYINALTAASVVRGLGARVLSGLTGNVSIPKELDSPAIGWVAENAALSSDDADFGSVTLSPKHCGALSEYSRNMLMQSSPAIEELLRSQLGRNLSLGIDRAAIRGGGANEPVGVLATSAIQKVVSPGSIFAGVADAVALADIENVGARRGLLTTPEMRKIAATALDALDRPIGVATVFHDLPVTFSNQMPKTLGAGAEHGLIYADWSELLIGVWSEIDVLVNPFESGAYAKGNISIRAMATVDVAIRNPKSFVSIEDVTTSTPAMPIGELAS